jgi:large subunit ribosomal protein L19
MGLSAKVAQAEALVNKTKLPHFKVGDSVRVHVKIIESGKERVQSYEGVVMARQNRQGGKSFTVRKMSHGVGVERIFMEASPKVSKLEIVAPGSVRRAKLYYLRGLEGKKARIEKDIERHSEVGNDGSVAAAAPETTKK